MGNAIRYSELAVDSRNANSIGPKRIADDWDRRRWTMTDTSGMRWFTDTPTRRHTANIELVIVDASRGDAFDSFDGQLWQSKGDTHTYVLELSESDDGIVQVTEALQRLSGIVAIHLVTSGDGRSIRLGSSRLDHQSIRAHAGELARWNPTLSPGARIVVHGCGLQATGVGRDLLESIATLCDCEVTEFADTSVREVAVDGTELVYGGEWGPEAASGCGSILVIACMNSDLRAPSDQAISDRESSAPARSPQGGASALGAIGQLAFPSHDACLNGDRLVKLRVEVVVGADACRNDSTGVSQRMLGNAMLLAGRTSGCDAFSAVHVDVCPQIDLQVSAAVVHDHRPRSSNLAVPPSRSAIPGAGETKPRSEGRIASPKEQIWVAPFVVCPVGEEPDEIGSRVSMNLLALPSVSESLVVKFDQDPTVVNGCGCEIASNSTEGDSSLCTTWIGSGTGSPDRDSASRGPLGHACSTNLVTPSIAESTMDRRNESQLARTRSTATRLCLRLESVAGYPCWYVERVPVAKKSPCPDNDCRLVYASCEIAMATFTIDTNSDRNQTSATGALASLGREVVVAASGPHALRSEPLMVAGASSAAAEIVRSESVVGRALVIGFDFGQEMRPSPVHDRFRYTVPARPLAESWEFDAFPLV